jgi:hypothetical protein
MTNNKQQTALQEFWGKISLKLSFEQIDEFVPLFYQAKEMEKKQHKKTWFDSTSQFDNAAEMTFKKDFDDHYNETYGGGKQ